MAETTNYNTICFKRGTTSQNNAYLGRAGEITIDTEEQSLRVHDGVTAGGHCLARIEKNVITNGSFQAWRYNTTQTTTGYGSDDRWLNSHYGTGVAKTHSQGIFAVGQTDVPRAKYYSSTAVTSTPTIATDAYCLKSQRIPYVDTLQNSRVVLSFSAKGSTGSLKIGTDILQSFGSGGSSEVAIPGEVLSLTTAWKRYSTIFDLPSISGKTIGTDDSLRLRFFFTVGSSYNTYFRGETVGEQSGTFDLANVQLQPGSIATEFNDEEYFGLLDYCQYFYQKGRFLLEAPSAGTTAIANYFVLPHRLRSVSAASISYSDLVGNVSKITERRNTASTNNITPTSAPTVLSSNTVHVISFYHRNTGSALNGIAFDYTIDSEL